MKRGRTRRKSDTRSDNNWGIVAAFVAFVIVLFIGFSTSDFGTTGFVTSSSYCIDSDGSGADQKYFAGTVKKGNIIESDWCNPNPEYKQYLREYFCYYSETDSTWKIVSKLEFCEYGCQNNACIR